MNNDLSSLLKSKAINGWRLFYLVCIPLSLLMFITTLDADISSGAGVSAMIGFSVRWAVPFIFLVIAISSLQTLFPGPIPQWLLRNRKYIGFCFAVAMAWQGLFIAIMSTVFRDYYINEVYLLRDELEGSIGYIFLSAMVLTSFNFTRKHLSAKQWKLIHESGIHFLWAYPFSVYWWTLSYYGNPQPIDYLYYWGGFLALALRIAAWGKKRQNAVQRKSPAVTTPGVLKMFGGTIIALGLFIAASGSLWQSSVTPFLTDPAWSADLLLWFPFWPFEPFLSLFVIGFGTLLLTTTKESDSLAMSSPPTRTSDSLPFS